MRALPLLLAACTATTPDTRQEAPVDTAPSAETDPVDTGMADTLPVVPERVFSFVVLADPHVTSPDGDAQHRLQDAVTWIDARAEDLDLRFVLVPGDVAWGTGMDAAIATFDTLSIPWVPVVGDNEVQSGVERQYAETFAPHLATLSDDFEGWELGEFPVANPERDEDSWFLNWRLTYEGVHIVGLDWGTRIKLPLIGENADLHDFEGGTYRWLERFLTTLPDGPPGRAVMVTHHPMLTIPGGFTLDAMARITALTSSHPGDVAIDYGGHFHLDFEQTELDGGYEVILTDATWDDEVRIRLVDVWLGPGGYRYEDRVIDVAVEP